MDRKKWAMIIPVMTATMLAIGWTHAATSSADKVRDAWLKRAELARKKIAEGKLDACDRGLEQAFLDVKEKNGGSERIFSLDADISGLRLRFGYGYVGDSVSSFFVAEIPPKSLVVQKPGSKTVSVLVGPANCALDLCAMDPFSDGPCRDR